MMKKIMIIHPEGNLNNNPNLTGIVEILCEQGYQVDIYSPRSGSFSQTAPCDGARFILNDFSERLDFSAVIPVTHFTNADLLSQYVRSKLPVYNLIIGVDRGIIEAGIIASLQKIPYGLISYEILFTEETGAEFKKLDVRFSRDIAFAVCQDRVRSHHLSVEYDIPAEKILDIPVAGRGVRRGEKSYLLHDALGLDRSKKIALYIGNVDSRWTGIEELLETTGQWDKSWVLVLHHRYTQYGNDLIAKIQSRKNVFLSPFNEAPINELHQLLNAADIGIGLYVPQFQSRGFSDRNNLHYIGMASGKIATYLQHGLPILINDLGEMSSHTEKARLGIVAKQIGDIPDLLAATSKQDLQGLRANCYDFFENHLDLDKTAPQLLDAISTACGGTMTPENAASGLPPAATSTGGSAGFGRRIVLAANLVPFSDPGQLARQELCVESINAIKDTQLEKLSICFPDETLCPDGWEVSSTLSRSADRELGIDGKRKPFVVDLFNIAAEWAHLRGIDWFAITNSDIIFNARLVDEVSALTSGSCDCIAVSRTDISGPDRNGTYIQEKLEVEGYDVFFCRTDWWLSNQKLFKAYIFGERAWDNAYAAIMASHGDLRIIYSVGMCHHVKHSTNWLTGPYADYNISIYLGIDDLHRIRFTAFIKEVVARRRNFLSDMDVSDLVSKHFPRAGTSREEPLHSESSADQRDVVTPDNRATVLPKISIITVCYNAEKTLKTMLQSLGRQTYRNVEHIVIDGGSGDNTLAILKHYQESINILVSEPDKGIYDAMNKGICRASGDIIYFLNADDTLYDENILGNVAEMFNRFPLADVIYGDARLIYPDGRTTIATYPEMLSWDHFQDRTLCHQSVFTRREAFSRVGQFDPSYRLAADFAWIIDSIWNHDLNYQHAQQVLCNFSMSGSHGTADNSSLLEQERQTAIERHIRGRFDFIGTYQSSKVTVFALTIGDPVFPSCLEALRNQDCRNFRVDVIRDFRPVSAADQEMMRRCTTEYFIKLDEDMILYPDAVRRMTAYMDAAPENVGMICFHLYDDDREMKIQGIKIFRAASLSGMEMRDVRASDMEILEQMNERNISWVLHDDIVGRHGTFYTPESIYLRYKSMYEKDLSIWNVLTRDIRNKADKYRESGDTNQLFALLGAVHGIINAPFARDVEAKDFQQYNLRELELFRYLFMGNPPDATICELGKQPKTFRNQPLRSSEVAWHFRHGRPEDAAVAPRTTGSTSSDHTRPAGKRVLIACTHFWPSIGGVETIAGELGSNLAERGHRVEVATWARSDRTETTHRGITIVELEMAPAENGLPAWVTQLRSMVLSGGYDACLLLADPQNLIIWSLEGAQLPKGTRLLIQPLINEEGFNAWHNNLEFRSRLAAILKKADAVIAISRDGAEMRYFREEGITPFYIPNATDRLTGAAGFRSRYGIPMELPLFLNVANLWPVKNQDGLIRMLRKMPGDWRLVIIGHPSDDMEYVDRVRSEAAHDPRVMLLPGLPPAEIAAAMAEAEVFLLASHGEVSPVTIIEAMSHGKPWLATPTCGAVHDFAGGLIAPLEQFPEILNRLLHRTDLMNSLGTAGMHHWNTCFTWRKVADAWEQLIMDGSLQLHFRMPPEAATQMKLITGELDMHADAHISEFPLVSVIVPTYNRPGMLGDTLKSILDQTYHNIEIIVVNDAGADVEGIVTLLNLDGRISYARHAHNRGLGAARNTGIRIARGKYIAYLDDDDLFYPDHIQTLVETLEGSDCKVAYTDAHQAHQAMVNGRYTVIARDIPYSYDFDYDVILVKNFVPVLCFMHEKSCIDISGPFDESLTTHEDWDLWIRMSRHFRFTHVKKVTCEFSSRQDGSSMSSSKRYDFLRTAKIIYGKYRHHAVGNPAILEAQHNFLAALQSAVCEQQRQEETATAGENLNPDPQAGELEKARQLVHDGDYHQAEELYRLVLAADPDNCSALVGLGVMNLVRGLNAEAADAFSRALQVSCADAKALCGLGMARMNLGLPGEAFDLYKRALASDPDNLTALHELLKCAYELDRLAEAESCVERYLMYHPADIHILFSLAGLRFRLGKYAGALDSLEKVLAFESEYEGGVELSAQIRGALAASSAGTDPQNRSGTETVMAGQVTKGTMRSGNNSPDISIIIPLFNKLEYTLQCLEGVKAATPCSLNYEMILVDNASTDGTREFLNRLEGNVTVITNPVNLGFAKACNQGARVAKGKRLLFLNNDTIPRPGWLEPLVAGMEQDGAAICGSRLIYPDNRIQHAGVAFNENGIGYHIFNGFDASAPAVNRKRFMQCVTAACMLVDKALFQELEGFDEGYINGFEDVDFCLRAGERGKSVLYVPDSLLIHFEETSEGRKKHDEVNARRFLSRWSGRVRCDDDEFYRQEGFRKELQPDGRTMIFMMTPQEKQLADNARQKCSSTKVDTCDDAPEIMTPGELCIKGNNLANAGKLDEAEQMYRQALAADQTCSAAFVGIGALKLLEGKNSEAAMAFSNAHKASPDNVKAICGLGLAYSATGKQKEAFEQFRAALAIDPEDLTALHELLKVSYELDRLDEAEPVLQNYLRYHPADSHLLFSLAGLRYRMGRYPESLDVLEQLLLLNPDYEGATELLQQINTMLTSAADEQQLAAVT